MKHNKFSSPYILFVLVLSIALFSPFSLSLAVTGTPHFIYGKVLNSDGTPPETAYLDIYAYVPARPEELLDKSSVGCGYDIFFDGWLWFESGNLITPWSINEKLRIVAIDTQRLETGVMDVVLDSSGSQHIPDLHLLPGDSVGPIASNAMANGGSPITIPEGAASITVTATVDDSICGNSTIKKAEYFIDTDPGLGSGILMNPEDGSFNSPQEGITVSVNTSSWTEGSTHNVNVRGQDIANNWGPTHVVVVSVTKPEFLYVAIDIKPGSYPNSIYPDQKGTIPVAILWTPDFDAPSIVDRTSLSFGRTGDENSLSFCSPSPKDVNGDGHPDLICHFTQIKTGFQCGDIWGYLKGKKVDGMPIKGQDSVRIMPCK
jgi:hypothetical protein